MSARLSLGLRLSLLFAACTAAVSLLAGLIFSRASEAHFIELDQQLLNGKLAIFRDVLNGVGSAEQLAPHDAELRRELERHPDLGLRLQGPDGQRWFWQLPAMNMASDEAPA